MAGWDLELIKLFLKSNMQLTMVGDPRQTVYLTHHERKNAKYAYGKIKEYILAECPRIPCKIDELTLCTSHRNSSDICELSSKLFPSLSPCDSKLSQADKHMGIYFVKIKNIQQYYDQYSPMLLCLQSTTQIHIDAPCMTFGHSKGLESKHVLFYPTAEMLKWLCGEPVALKVKTCAQLYVALTRASFSVGIAVPNNFNKTVNGINMWP